ncbi:MAG: metallophosphatase family protein [Coriobacteriales bacterium]|jgi:putative phosphoesterase|nr:metallophosphatase family protein [Coriobacteriales bacterium]
MIYTVGIVSDTHGRLPSAVLTAFAGCDYILHAGDIGAQSVLDELEATAPVTAVLGNCDWPEHYTNAGEVSEWAHVEVGGVSFFMMHRPEDVMAALRGHGLPPNALATLPQVCVHGHTHIPRTEQTGASLTLCPGSPTRPRGGSNPSVALLTINEGTVKGVEFVEL